jgi:prepilin-type N-terminal cleavage/methylation domain-containing protein
MKLRDKIKKGGFTLVELLIVIAILAVLAAAVVIVLNPAELIAQGRDSQRITDIKTLKDAIDMWIVDNPSQAMGTTQTVYISLPDTSVTCANITGLPALPLGWQYHCVTEANLRNTDATGWVPLNLASIYGGSPIPYLPVDPQNDITLTKYYSYIPGGSYVLTTLLESEKQTKIANADGGNDAGRFEAGSDMSLWTTASGLQGYWNFEEGSGLTVSSVPAGITGTIYEALWTNGKSGNGLSFDNSDDKTELASSILLSGPLTVAFWGYSNGYSTHSGVGGNQADYATGGRISFYENGSQIRFETNNSYTLTATTSPFPTGQWMHVAITRDLSNRIRIYKNGEEVTSGSPTRSGTLTLNRIGDNPDTSGYKAWNGVMDEYRVYDRQLTASEIRAIHNAGK